jgi:hypothetical protein
VAAQEGFTCGEKRWEQLTSNMLLIRSRDFVFFFGWARDGKISGKVARSPHKMEMFPRFSGKLLQPI